ncbi:hypothetical protein [Streptomyces sp. NPDC058572]|uniref:hypothetical protein n=1 Tax=Streptomyces sp. NPDC058572 TaxID=3346546 RepID=UPI00364A5B6C
MVFGRVPDVLITGLTRASRELDGVTFGGCGKVLATATNEEIEMNHDEALEQLGHAARERAFGRHVGSDRLIQVGLDALMAGVESPSLAMLAGLLRSEEPEASALFDQVLEELGLLFQPPVDPRAAKWALAYWIAGQIVDGSLDPAIGTHLIWADVAYDLNYPGDLQALVSCAINLDDWDESWGVSVEALKEEAIEAAERLLSKQPPEARTDCRSIRR